MYKHIYNSKALRNKTLKLKLKSFCHGKTILLSQTKTGKEVQHVDYDTTHIGVFTQHF